MAVAEHWRLPDQACALLCSDMHLGGHDPGTAAFFFSALDHVIDEATHLILLGDVFEAWAGDDAIDPVAARAIDRLTEIARERPVAIMRGNRDFLLDVPLADPAVPAFSQRTGARMLAEPTLLELGGQRVLLGHGDAWCVDDHDYMAFRTLTRSAQWQRNFLALPRDQRLEIAQDLRKESRARQSGDTMVFGDVDEATVRTLMRDSEVDWLIHGHTHRPDHHRIMDDGRERHRLVLPDWDARDQRGGFIRLDRTGPSVLPAVARQRP
ncbi:MAG: UDP-2,3-diacylglucosamine diphosphatase [Burkholderiaceae bacterium]